ncbi:methyl-accepting chemotaxis protein, partial [Halomonas sp. SIMBA_159]
EQLAVNQTQISTVIHNNSENAQRELSEIEQVAAAATELSSTASDVAHNAHSAETAAIEAITIINASSSTLQRSDSIAESVSDSMKESARIINELREHSEK